MFCASLRRGCGDSWLLGVTRVEVGTPPWGRCSFQSMIHSRPLATSASVIISMYRYTTTLQRNSVYTTVICYLPTRIIILGDVNVPYGDVGDAHNRALRDILSDANLWQNVTDETHNRGNILDLIITSISFSPITRVSVDDLVADHYAIICHLITTKPRPPRKNVTYRRY